MAVFSVHAQNTPGWLADKRGHLSASRMSDAIAFSAKGKPLECRKKHMMELVTERITDRSTDRFVTAQMLRGIELEPAARERYEEVTGNLVQQVGFAWHDTIEYFGASSDGLVGTSGAIEIKCHNDVKHLTIIEEGIVPLEHRPQMAAQCLVLGREWNDFVAYNPDMPEQFQIFIKRYTPTEEELSAIETGAIQFLAEVDQLFDKLTRGDF